CRPSPKSAPVSPGTLRTRSSISGIARKPPASCPTCAPPPSCTRWPSAGMSRGCSTKANSLIARSTSRLGSARPPSCGSRAFSGRKTMAATGGCSTACASAPG
ncbi:MAG: His repressor, partial [uncultured Sphingomonas sp.]